MGRRVALITGVTGQDGADHLYRDPHKLARKPA
jgi:GDP-D-mannose dehydratase